MAADTELEHAVGARSGPSRLTVALLGVIAVAVAALAVALGYAWGSSGSNGTALPMQGSVDAGFARDMAIHHQQAITMAGYVRDNSTDPEVVTLAFDIETSQSVQMGQMIGWLDTWGISRTYGAPMDWMPGHHAIGAGGLMPGMATPDQMNRLLSLHGKALDVLFLQLMIRHHQGGAPMAQYAVAHAKELYVRNLAQAILNDQLPQVTQMEQMLRQRGGTPLPPPQS
jgi:uncharacterized protein (DUF305 family)